MMTSDESFWRVGDTYYQAQILRHGRGLDYDCPPRRTREEAESDLADSLGMMTERERQQSEIESYVVRCTITAVEEDGSIAGATGRSV